MEKFLGTSKYLFRDIDKYNGILKVITAVNGYNRSVYDINGTSTLFTTHEDIEFFIEILEQYHISIVSNLSPGALDILNELTNNRDKYINSESVIRGVMVSTYMEESGTTDAKRSVQRYFRELGDNGFLKELERKGHNIVWQIGKDLSEGMEDIILSNEDRKVILFNYGEDVLSGLENDESRGISLKQQHGKVPIPYWGNCIKIEDSIPVNTEQAKL
jgi:hypothetical protein